MTSRKIARDCLLKEALRFVGIGPPRRHDPGAVLFRHLDRFPSSWRDRAPAICEVSERPFAERGHTFYGDEDDLVPPSELFERAEAQEAIATVGARLALYRELLAAKPPA